MMRFTRQVKRAANREMALDSVQSKFGIMGRQSGQFCYQVGMTRRSARRIARKLAAKGQTL